MVNRVNWILFLLLSGLWCGNAWAEVSARVDRTVVNEGETLRLIVDASEGEPDLSPLNALFDVLGTSRNSQMSFVNGRVQSKNEWLVNLSPKQTGNLTIPSLKVGSDKTRPIQIQVREAGQRAPLSQGQDVFIEVSATPLNPYVQSQVIYTVKLYHAPDLQNGALSEPKHEDVVFERFGDDVNYSTQVRGRAFQVTERRFAIFPQKSGKIHLPPTVFGGQVVSGGGAAFDPFNRFFSQPQTRAVRLRSQTIDLDVRPQPVEAAKDVWLPAKSLTVSASWSSDVSKLKAGEPVTLTLRMEAEGLSGVQLPAMNLELGDEFKTYPDQPVVETLNNGNSLVGVREQKLAIIPIREGEFSLPAIAQPWWDVKSDKRRIARAALGSLSISKPLASQNTVPELPSSTPEPGPVNAVESDAAMSNSDLETPQGGFWMWLAIIAVSGWLLTVLVWVFSGKRVSVTENEDSKASTPNAGLNLREVKFACLKNEARMARNAIVSWAQASFPEKQPVSLQDVQKELSDPIADQKFAELNGILYREKANTSWDGHDFWEKMEPVLNARTSKKKPEQPTRLPPLYQ